MTALPQPAALLAAGLPAGLALAALLWMAARREVRRLSEGIDDIDPWRFVVPVLAAFLVAIPVAAAKVPASGGDAESWLAAGIVLAIPTLLAGLAVVDRETAWVPDALLFPLAAVSGAHLSLASDLPVLAGFLAGPGILLLLRLLDGLMASRLASWPPPADLFAFLLAPVLLGLDEFLAALLLAAGLVLVTLRGFPSLARIVIRPETAARAREDLGYDNPDRLAVPLLAILFPLLAVAFLLRACLSA